MHNEFKTAANSKNHVGDAPVQIISNDRAKAALRAMRENLKEAQNLHDYAINNRATTEEIAYWQGREAALQLCINLLTDD